jgi:5-methylcytosine-specific restriction endonuclease McrA
MNDYSLIRMYRCDSKAKSANKRFEDKIDSFDVLFSLKLNDFKCFYCNDKIDCKNWQLDHFHPRANNGLNKRENLVACCKWCNTMKNALDGNAFINKCNQILQNNFFVKKEINNITSNKVRNVCFRKAKKVLKKYEISEKDLESIRILIYNI